MIELQQITRLHDFASARNLADAMTIGERIRDLREKAGFKRQGDFAEALGQPQSQVSDWETGRYKKIEIDTLSKISVVVGVTLVELVDGVEGYEALARVLKPRPSTAVSGQEAEELDIDVNTGYKRNDIPVIGEGEASPQPNLFWDEAGLRSDVEDRISRPFDVRDPRAYGVKVRGDSMMPRYKPGETVVVSPNSDVEDGDEVYVALLSGERLLKIARRAPGGWILESENRAYPARFVKKSEIGTMHPILWIRPARRSRGDRKNS